MRRLYVLVSRAIQNNEPVLLVGDTGCGKTTVCQLLADAFEKVLHTVNVHQNSETGDLIGSQRPLRNRVVIEAALRHQLLSSWPLESLEAAGSCSQRCYRTAGCASSSGCEVLQMKPWGKLRMLWSEVPFILQM